MVENIDYNVGLLRSKLEELGLAENTIFIFMTDNGTANGAKFEGLTSEAKQGYNAGMRGKKSSVYEGGHRVPFFIHWPGGELVGGRDVDSISAHIDVLPTLAELCEISVPESHQPDGVSFAALLKDVEAPAHRDHHVIQFQGGPGFSGSSKMWEYSCVLKNQWRLIDGKELYDIKKGSFSTERRGGCLPGRRGRSAVALPAVLGCRLSANDTRAHRSWKRGGESDSALFAGVVYADGESSLEFREYQKTSPRDRTVEGGCQTGGAVSTDLAPVSRRSGQAGCRGSGQGPDCRAGNGICRRPRKQRGGF